MHICRVGFWTLTSVALATLLGACDSYGDKGRFLYNDHRIVVDSTRLAQIQKAWRNDPRQVFAASRASSSDVAWISDFIAMTEGSGVSPCTSLTAVSIKALELRPFKAYNASTKVYQEFAPSKYYEAWYVDACGKSREWRVLDDPATPTNPLTVLLFK